MKTEFEDAARNVEQTVSKEINQTTSDLNSAWSGTATEPADSSTSYDALRPPPEYKHPNKHWRVKRSAMPQWYKQKSSVRAKALSGAARVARFRPPQP